jgi:hypothetical protein
MPAHDLRLLAIGEFNLSRNFLVTLALQGHRIAYGYVGKPRLPDPVPGLEVFRLPRDGRSPRIREMIEEFRPDCLYVGSAGYDGSNALASEVQAADLGIPMIRVYKEFLIQASEREEAVLTGSDGVVLHSEAVAGYFTALYGLDRDKVHIFDHDVVADHLIPDRPATEKLSDRDGVPHVVLGGTMKDDGSGYDYREFIVALADRGVRVHVYPAGFSRWLSPGRVLDPDSERVRSAYSEVWQHPNVRVEELVAQTEQLSTWSRYDAGVMQVRPRSYVPALTPWQQMDHPSKHSYYLEAGLPIAVNRATLSSLQTYLDGYDVMLRYDTVDELAAALHERPAIARLGKNVARRRGSFCLGARLPGLLSFVERLCGRPAPRARV